MPCCAVLCVTLQDAWVPELLNSCLLLYAWRVGFNYKMIHSLSSTVISSSAALEDLDRMISTNSGAQVGASKRQQRLLLQLAVVVLLLLA